MKKWISADAVCRVFSIFLMAVMVAFKLIIVSNISADNINFWETITFNSMVMNVGLYFLLSFWSFSSFKKRTAFFIVMAGVLMPVLQVIFSRGFPSIYTVMVGAGVSIVGFVFSQILERKYKQKSESCSGEC